MHNTEITIDELIAFMGDEDVEDWGNYEHFAWESQVETVARAIREIHTEREVDRPFSFDWTGELEGVVNGATVGFYDRPSNCYLVKFDELKGLTMDRAATGRAQVEAIYEALMIDYRAASKFTVEPHDPEED